MVKQGDAVIVHGLRGRPCNRKLPAETQRQAVTLLKQPDWHDFGPTVAIQQLAKRQPRTDCFRSQLRRLGFGQPGGFFDHRDAAVPGTAG
jgi:hypothetical protein